ncbi:MAG: hypothetical protein ACRDZ3_01405 [Acidimicrobiia bacterium]
MSQRRRVKRTGVLDFWQNILDDTRDFVDDSIDRVRDDDRDDDVSDDIDELKQAVAELNAKLDRLVSEQSEQSKT